jgi:hypothetical protein
MKYILKLHLICLKHLFMLLMIQYHIFYYIHLIIIFFLQIMIQSIFVKFMDKNTLYNKVFMLSLFQFLLILLFKNPYFYMIK